MKDLINELNSAVLSMAMNNDNGKYNKAIKLANQLMNELA